MGTFFGISARLWAPLMRRNPVSHYSHAEGGFAYDSIRHIIATWTFNETIPADKLRIGLSDALQTPAGNPLDGEWLDLSRNFSSGDGTPSGDFVFRFNVLPGDVDQNLVIDEVDIRATASQFWTRPGDERYAPLAEIMADGVFSLLNLVGHRNRQGTTLSNGEPVQTNSPPAAAEAVVMRAIAARSSRVLDEVLRFNNEVGRGHRIIARLVARRRTDADGAERRAIAIDQLVSHAESLDALRQPGPRPKRTNRATRY